MPPPCVGDLRRLLAVGSERDQVERSGHARVVSLPADLGSSASDTQADDCKVKTPAMGSGNVAQCLRLIGLHNRGTSGTLDNLKEFRKNAAQAAQTAQAARQP